MLMKSCGPSEAKPVIPQASEPAKPGAKVEINALRKLKKRGLKPMKSQNEPVIEGKRRLNYGSELQP
jgi:hypothetical protein